MKNIFGVILIISLFSCGGDKTENDDIINPSDDIINPSDDIINPSTNLPPSTPNIVYPENNLLCLNNELTFLWSGAEDPEKDIVTYEFLISSNRAFTEIIENRISPNTSIDVVLNKGNSYYWKVLAKDDNDNKSNFSEVSGFYVEGDPLVNHIPFTAKLIYPENDKLIASSNNINLKWDTHDVDNDELKYQLFFGTSEDPLKIEDGLTSNEYQVNIESGKTYYWKVNVTDEQSTSIGDIWKFSVQ